ncbi:MAG TPA: energy transducer TonB [Candidatus Acidoferrales bacterium]|nr:energy transducer TonB [Candidatus Acidoferrales bacterium]
MFAELPISNPGRRPTRTRWTFLVSFAAEATVLAVVLLVPLLQTQALPKLWMTTSVTVWAPEPPPMPLKPTVVPETIQKAPDRWFHVPVAIPHGIEKARSEPPVTDMAGPSVPGAIPGSQSNTGDWLVPSQPAAPSAPATPKRITLGGQVQAAKLIRMVRVEYPATAQQAGIQGSVVLKAIIAADGSVEALQYISGPPLLVRAAMDAVRQWRYQPTLLNGHPVEVETSITVNFTLNRTPGS